MKIVFDFYVYFLGQQRLKLIECQKQFLKKPWKWLKDISGNNQAVWYLYTKFVIICNFDLNILQQFSICSESCLCDILKR